MRLGELAWLYPVLPILKSIPRYLNSRVHTTGVRAVRVRVTKCENSVQGVPYIQFPLRTLQKPGRVWKTFQGPERLQATKVSLLTALCHLFPALISA